MIGRSVESINDILAKIIRAKRVKKEECVLFINQRLYDTMEEAGVVIHWEENHPGVVYIHCDICGLPAVIDNKIEHFSVMTLNEARELIYERNYKR